MKSFFEEYGKIIVTAVVAISLIAVTVALKPAIQNNLDGLIGDMSNGMGSITISEVNVGGGAGGSSVDMTNINISNGTTILAAGDFSTKGNLVTINDTQYRVLKVDDTQVKVVSIESYIISYYNSSSATTDFNGTDGQKYEGSLLDNKMTNFYNSLPEVIRDAIVPQTINQSMYQYQNSSSITGGAIIQYYSDFDGDGYTDFNVTSDAKRGLLKTAEITVGERNVYVLDIDDIKEYLGSEWKCQELNTLFFDTTKASGRYIWLRSARSGNSNSAFQVSGNYGHASSSTRSDSGEARPAFVIDLSLLS